MDYTTAHASDLLALPKEELVAIIFQLSDHLKVLTIHVNELTANQKKDSDDMIGPQ